MALIAEKKCTLHEWNESINAELLVSTLWVEDT